jgi:hypothetical protein
MAGAERSGLRSPRHGVPEDTEMTKDQKIIRAKVGLLELAVRWHLMVRRPNRRYQ